jgi:aminoglycoside phosphotransferase (APT) family kinase protein
VLCWGDGRLSNILYGPQFEVAAVRDWEIAYIGDPDARAIVRAHSAKPALLLD